MLWRRPLLDKYCALRKRVIAETEIGLLIGLLAPERVQRIPTVEVSNGAFEPAFAARFWQDVLGIDEQDYTMTREAILLRGRSDHPRHTLAIAGNLL